VSGTHNFNTAHYSEAILRKLMDIRFTFGLYPILPDTHPMTLGEMWADPPAAFALEDGADMMALTTDRASNMIRAAETGRTFDWMPCICHLLHTAVNHALEHAGILQYLKPLRALSKSLRKRPSLWWKFQKIQRECIYGSSLDTNSEDEDYSSYDDASDDDGVYALPPGEELVVDPTTDLVQPPTRVLRLGSWVKTRWNSTYFLIKRALKLEPSVRTLVAGEDAERIPLNAWGVFRSLLPSLDSIKDFAERCEGDEYVTISDVLPNVLKLIYVRLDIPAHELASEPDLREFLKHFKDKLIGDLDDQNLIYAWSLASAVDGRRKRLNFLRHIWQNADKDHWCNVVKKYKTMSSFKGMVREEMTNLVSSAHNTLHTVHFAPVYLCPTTCGKEKSGGPVYWGP
jgi:hypothetical protein